MSVDLLAALAFVIALTVVFGCARAGVWADQGLTDEANDIGTDQNGWTIHLFDNNYTPLTTSVLGDYNEATFSGYVAKSYGATTIGAIVGDTIPISSNPATWTNTLAGAADNIYGYYLTDGGGNYVGAERFPMGPYDMGSLLGATLNLTITEPLTRV